MEEKCRDCCYSGRCKGNNTLLQTNSFIEECFYRKCNENAVCGRLLLEWIDSKCVYVRYLGFSRSDCGSYSRHDDSHSVAILNAIVSVIGKRKIEQLSATDLWLLLHCAYAHDIGMPFSYGQMSDFWGNIRKDSDFENFFKECLTSDDSALRNAADYINSISEKLNVELSKMSNSDEKSQKFGTEWPAKVYRYTSYLTAEYVRKNHALRSEALLESCDIFRQKGCMQVESRFYKIVAKCCMLHASERQDIIKEIPQHEWDIESGNCHPRFVAYMIRLGDLLDIDNNRFDWMDLQHYGFVPERSVLHRKKHESIIHIKYTDKVIEITAQSDDSDVCQLANDWFEEIKNEVRFIATHWTEFAPNRIGGCTLSEPVLQVYLGNEKFYRVEDCEFRIDKDTLIELVIGRNLYKTKFDFLREYVQNALDASKMKFWVDVCEGRQDFWVFNEDSVWNMQKRELLPFDINETLLRQYTLEIICDYVEKECDSQNVSSEFISIEIIDRGIGIDQECIEAISNIGTGWNKRKKYSGYLASMPDWLKPTGGFGIGMQSGFMITNEIHIQTHCENEPYGRKIDLYSGKGNGKIEEHEISVRQIGTRITVDVPYEWFMDEDNYKEYQELGFDTKMIDFMDTGKMTELITEFVEKYIKIILGNPLFPIVVKQKGGKASIISRFWLESKNEYSHFTWDGMSYLVYFHEQESLIWDQEQGILCHIVLDDRGKVYPTEKWFFKGVRVWTDDSENDISGLYRYIGNFEIDIMGIPVINCLTIDRNRFKNGFDYRGLSNKYAVVFLNYLAEEDKMFCGYVTGKAFIRCICAYRYLSERGKKIIRLCLDSMNVESWISNYDMLLPRLFVDKETEESPYETLYEMCKNLYFENKLYWVENETKIENDAKLAALLDSTVIWDVSDDSDNVVAPILRDMMAAVYRPSAKCIENKNKEFRIYHYHETECVNKVVQESKEEVLYPVRGRRQIFNVEDDMYPQLHVTKIPFGDKVKGVGTKKGNRNIIISPMPAMLADDDFAVALKKKEKPEECFMNQITDNQMYQRLLDWVFRYQKAPSKYTKTDIDNAYRDLIKFMYTAYIKPKMKELL